MARIQPRPGFVAGELWYNGPMLTDLERKRLEAFVARNREGAPYWRRVNILLLNEEGLSPEDIALATGSSVAQTRRWLNVFKRQGMSLFPDPVLREPGRFSADDSLAEAGRLFLADQLAIIDEHQPVVTAEAGPKGVHETRKAIRRSRNAFRLLAPYYEPGFFRPYRRALRRVMRGLGPSRDRFVALQKLAEYMAEEDTPAGALAGLQALHDAWSAAWQQENLVVQVAVSRPGYLKQLAAYRQVLQTPGAGVARPGKLIVPLKVRHVAPVLIFERLATVLAYDDYLAGIRPAGMHQLRIAFKQLRYTLDFFTPVLGNEILSLTDGLNGIQDHLGDMNDAVIMLGMLAKMDPAGELADGVAHYRQVQQITYEQLAQSFDVVWAEFNSATWRQRLAGTLAVL